MVYRTTELNQQGDRDIPLDLIHILHLTNMGNLAMVWEDAIYRSPKAPYTFQVRPKSPDETIVSVCLDLS